MVLRRKYFISANIRLAQSSNSQRLNHFSDFSDLKMTKDKVEKYVGSWKQVKAENMDAVRVIFSSNDGELYLNL